MLPSYTDYLGYYSGLLRPRFVSQNPSLLTSSEKDFAYLQRRFKGEGIRLLTVTLPELRKAVDRSFETGRLETPNSFRKYGGTSLPTFLISHFERIYDKDGFFLPKPHITSLKHVRQVLETFYKLQVPYDKSVNNQTIERFVENERYVRAYLSDSVALFGDPSHQRLVSGAALLCRYVFKDFDPMDIIPGNGPGRLATGELGDQKWIFSTKVDQIHQVFPYYKYFYHSTNMLGDSLVEYKNLREIPEGTSKVKLVPKDSRGPRIITMEPHSYMWIQQGLRARLYDWFDNRCSLTKGHMNFTDQSVNQSLALNSSLSGEWATLDMKDASDLLSVDLVERIFRLKPGLLDALLGCRSSETELPSGKLMRLKKFAGMGSATCFPIEAFVFWAICASEIAFQLDISLREATSFVYVFGDDIIVPSALAEDVITALEFCGLIVNRSKSYYNGKFRESCGVDAYLSVDITPLRIKKLFPASLNDGESFVAWCSYANNFAARGYTKLAETIFGRLETTFGTIPYGTSTSPYPCRIVTDPSDAEELNKASKIKWKVRSRYQRLEFKVYHLVPVDQPSTLDGWNRLTRNLIAGAGERPSVVVLPNATKLVLGWMAV